MADAPQVLGVGDLHVENFGTWRDAEGRLIWGINDLDEAATLPYTQDLVRLAASALFAIEEARLTLSARGACEVITEGYTEGLRTGGGPAVLAERYRWLRDLAVAHLKDQRPYWQKMRALRTVPGRAHRRSGACSWPRCPRGDWKCASCTGGPASAASGASVWWPWPTGAAAWSPARPSRSRLRPGPGPAIRACSADSTTARSCVARSGCPDPCVEVHGDWLIRRLAPDCSRIELANLPRGRDESRLLWMMGWETANVHLGTPAQRRPILGDLGRRKNAWLVRAAQRMCEGVRREFRRWRKFARDD